MVLVICPWSRYSTPAPGATNPARIPSHGRGDPLDPAAANLIRRDDVQGCYPALRNAVLTNGRPTWKRRRQNCSKQGIGRSRSPSGNAQRLMADLRPGQM
jgi:hypothetical protein